jgi:hypothetical protein
LIGQHDLVATDQHLLLDWQVVIKQPIIIKLDTRKNPLI